MRKERFIKAAKLIGNYKEEYCCMALTKAIGPDSKEEEFFKQMLKPLEYYADWAAWYSFGLTAGPYEREQFNRKQNRTARILGLLLMAEIAKDENK